MIKFSNFFNDCESNLEEKLFHEEVNQRFKEFFDKNLSDSLKVPV